MSSLNSGSNNHTGHNTDELVLLPVVETSNSEQELTTIGNNPLTPAPAQQATVNKRRLWLFPVRQHKKQATGNNQLTGVNSSQETGNSEQETVNKSKQQSGNKQATGAGNKQATVNKFRSLFPWKRKQQATKQLTLVNNEQTTDKQFKSLAWLEVRLQWFEQFITVLAPRLLVVVFVVAMLDLLTHGGLLTIPVVSWGSALVQAVAVEASLTGLWRLAFVRFDERRFVSGGVLLFIGAALAIVVFAALSLSFLQQSVNLSLDQAMSRLWLNAELLTYIRSGSVVFLAIVLTVLARTRVTVLATGNKTVNRSRQQNSKQATNNRQQSVNSKQQQVTSVNSEQVTNRQQALTSDESQEQEQVTSNRQQLTLIHSRKPLTEKQQAIKDMLLVNPDASVTDIAQATGNTKPYVSRLKPLLLAEIAANS
jgi:hypothetical protein